MQQAKLRREVTGADEVQEISESAEEVAEIVPGLRAKKTSPKPVGDEMQEKDIARVLVSMGGEWWDEKNSITVAEYILRNLEEVIDAFDHRIYQRIAQETLELLRSKKPVQPQYFINHSDEAIAAEAIELLQIRHEMSPGWEERGIYLRSQKPPDANFSKDSQQALLRFKLRKILRLCDQNQKRLTDLSEKSDPTQMQTFLKVHQRLLQMRDELAKELGTVIIR
jgi:DNA primase